MVQIAQPGFRSQTCLGMYPQPSAVYKPLRRNLSVFPSRCHTPGYLNRRGNYRGSILPCRIFLHRYWHESKADGWIENSQLSPTYMQWLWDPITLFQFSLPYLFHHTKYNTWKYLPTNFRKMALIAGPAVSTQRNLRLSLYKLSLTLGCLLEWALLWWLYCPILYEFSGRPLSWITTERKLPRKIYTRFRNAHFSSRSTPL